MTDTPLSAEFIRQICTTFRLYEPAMQKELTEQRELRTYIALLRTAIEMTEEPNADFVTMLTRVIAHMENMTTIVKRLQTLAKQVNAVMGEYEV